MDNVVQSQPTSKLTFSEQVLTVELSPFEWSQNLICIAFAEEIVVGEIKFQENDEGPDEVVYTPIRTFHHDTRAQTIAWSPETSLSIVPKIVAFCVAGADFKIRLFNSNLNDVNIYEVLQGHKDYVNSVAYEPEGELIASVSDDHTCKLWTIKDQKCVSTFYLTSPGMSACWHNEESGKLLVAEKNGLIHMFNVRSQQAIISMDAGMIPLAAADWSCNPLKVACVATGELLVWDVSRPSRPASNHSVHVENAMTVKFSTQNENLVASIGSPDHQLVVTNLRTNQVVLKGSIKLPGGLTWHYKLPYVCAGSDRELLFWRVNSK